MTLAIPTTTKRLAKCATARFCLILLTFFSAFLCAEEETTTTLSQKVYPFFIPPQDWEIVDVTSLSPKVIIGFMEKDKKGFCPSMNLAIEKVNVSLNEYVKAVKKLHEIDSNTRWRDLGKLNTPAGMARITEIDTKTKWGPVRMLQLILVKEEKAYILTAAAPKEDFSRLYPSLKKSFHSFTLTEDLLSFVKDSQKSDLLREKILHVKQASIAPLEPKEDETPSACEWVSFTEYLIKEHSDMGAFWQLQILQMIQNEIASSL